MHSGLLVYAEISGVLTSCDHGLKHFAVIIVGVANDATDVLDSPVNCYLAGECAVLVLASSELVYRGDAADLSLFDEVVVGQALKVIPRA